MPESLRFLLVQHALLAVALVLSCYWRAGAEIVRPLALMGGVGFLFLTAWDGRLTAVLFLSMAIVASFRTTRGWGPQSVLSLGAVVTLALVGGFGLWRMTKVWQIDALREQYPLVSLRSRLDYEAQSLEARGRDVAAADSSGADSASARWRSDGLDRRDLQETDEARGEGWTRTSALYEIHSDFTRNFAAAPGFGSGRMAKVWSYRMSTPERVQRFEQPPEPLPPPPPVPSTETSAPPRHLAETAPAGTSAGSPGGSPAEGTYGTLHLAARTNFLASDGFGWVQDRDHVAGFVPHAFRKPFESALDAATPAVAWKVTTLQLVSLLRFDTPRVYETAGFPDMAALAAGTNLPTRPLDSFESTSLPSLFREREIVTYEGRNRIDMLGALRATRTCVECHQVREGTVLGAFRYVLSRDPAVAEPKPTL